jgi:hypothetical protein
MQTGLHAIGSGLQSAAIALGAAVMLALFAYALLVFILVVILAAASFGQ